MIALTQPLGPCNLLLLGLQALAGGWQHSCHKDNHQTVDVADVATDLTLTEAIESFAVAGVNMPMPELVYWWEDATAGATRLSARRVRLKTVQMRKRMAIKQRDQAAQALQNYGLDPQKVSAYSHTLPSCAWCSVCA